MYQYTKTHLGFEALKSRSIELNARQRRLLLLIGTHDFDQLNNQAKQHLAPLELLEQLTEMGLITHPLLHSEMPQQQVNIDISISSTISDFKAQPPEVNPSHFKILDFGTLQDFMSMYLQQYCGLLTQQLMKKIQNAQDVQTLKSCQMQWTTALQESKIPSQELNQALQQINYAIQQL